MDKVDKHNNIYPSLDETSPFNTSVFRLQEISKLRTNLENEAQERNNLYKKYKRTQNVLDGVDMGANSISLSLSICSGVMAGTGILIPIAVPLLITAGSLAAVGITCKFINRKLEVKTRKHNDIRLLAESKLNSILTIVNKAIEDNQISPEEFSHVVEEVNKYNDMKANIQTKVTKKQQQGVVTEEEKNAIIEQAKKDFINKLQ